jgi:hypothetical protein
MNSKQKTLPAQWGRISLFGNLSIYSKNGRFFFPKFVQNYAF